ncbi:MAG: hypothetical protein V1853_02980 [bacterium]
MQKLVLLGILFAFIVFSSPEIQAQNDISPIMSKEEVAELISDVYDAPAQKFLYRSFNGPDGRGVRVVFVYNGNRYTFDHDWFIDGILFWIRPDGTYSPNLLANEIYDKNMDGLVDLGTDGQEHLFAIANALYNNSVPVGSEHQQYWQDKFFEALAGLKVTLNQGK